MTFSHLNRFLPKRVTFNVKRIFLQFTEDLKARRGDTRFLKLRVSGNGLIVSFQWKVDGPIIQMLKKRKKGRNWPKFGVSVGEITGECQLPEQKSGKAWFSLYLVELTAARKSSRPPRTPRNYSGNTEPSGWPRGELKPRAQRYSLSLSLFSFSPLCSLRGSSKATADWQLSHADAPFVWVNS